MKNKLYIILLLLCFLITDSVYAKTTYSKPTNAPVVTGVKETISSTCYYYLASSKTDLIRVDFGRFFTGSSNNGNPSNYSSGFRLKRNSTNSFFNIYKNVAGKYDSNYKKMIIDGDTCEDILFYEDNSVFSWVTIKNDNRDYLINYCDSYPNAKVYCNYENDGDTANCTSSVKSCDDVEKMSYSGEYFGNLENPDIFEKDENGCPMIIKLPVFFLKKVVFNTLQIFVPIILIVMASVDLTKYLINPDDKKGDPVKKCMNRFIIAIAFFFITTVVSLILNRVAKTTSIKNTSDWRNCWVSIK